MTGSIDLTQINPDVLETIRALHKLGIRPPQQTIDIQKKAQLSCIEHMEQNFYIPETQKPIKLEPFQKIILKIIAGEHSYPTLLPFYSTVEYSSPKKHGKTACSGAYAFWRAESPVIKDEILFFANDETQSRGRAYAAIQTAIELNPLYDKQKRQLFDSQGLVVWRIIEDFLEHVPTNTRVRAVNVDYRGEAGSNPTLSCWTEAWGYDTEKQYLLFEEMTPVLTRTRSQRYLEGYAGYTGKSKLLERVENLMTNPELGSRQLTLDDIPDWPFPEESEALPLFVNDTAGMFAYIDRGPIARKRMPWTRPSVESDKYYAQQKITLPPEQYDRLHNNYWVNPTTAFIPIEWWYQCRNSALAELPSYREPITPILDWNDPLKLLEYMKPENWRVTNDPQAIVLGVDASIVGDCTGIIGVSRNPEKHQDCVLRHAYVWKPSQHTKLDYEYTPGSGGLSLKHQLIDLCLKYQVVEIAYDDWQLHHLMTELTHMAIAWCHQFSQSKARDIADKQLYDLIRGIKLTYNPEHPNICHQDLVKHIQGASRTQRSKEDTKLHIVKSSDDSKIDLVICLSMATAECLRLDL